MRRIPFIRLLLCILLASSYHGFCSDTLVAFNKYWRYLDNGSTAPSNWTSLAYVDSSWDMGQAEFGYGDGDENTVVSYGSDPNNKYVTTYFRHEFFVNNISAYRSLILYLKRDDGAIVYLNGSEVYRSNMPSGIVNKNTLAESSANWTEEYNTIKTGISLATLNSGYNLVSVELHQSSVTGSDASFDLSLIADTSAQLLRGPYLQSATPLSMMVCWRTSIPEISKVLFGTSLNFSYTITDTVLKTDHFLNLTGLQPSTKYYYAVCSSFETLHSDSNTFFITPPDTDTTETVRIWAMGDFGIGSMEQDSTRDAYYRYTGSQYTNIFLMLGDNAYSVGSDENYSSLVFKDHYEDILKQTVAYSTCGNHELLTSTASNQTGPYYDIFSFFKNGEAGGIPSGTEAYYSFNYGNIHFVCLESNVDSFGVSNLTTMLTWLDADLAANTKKWIIAYYHFPSLSKGYHDSDVNTTEIWCRENINPILEKYNVDLVLGGHSHVYERSHLLKGHFGLSGTLTPSMIMDSSGGAAPFYYDKSSVQDSGTVYSVVGSSSEITPIQPNWPHPAMYYSNAVQFGSMIIDVSKDTMDVKFLTNTDTIADQFTFIKITPPPPVLTSEIQRGPYLQISTPNEITVRWKTSLPEPAKLLYGMNAALSDSLIDTNQVSDHTVHMQGLIPNTKYFYAVRLKNDSIVGDSSYYFITPPVDGSIAPVRIWAMGEFGMSGQSLIDLRDSYYNHTASTYTNLLLWLGNNAYPSGSFSDYNANVFSPFSSILKNSCVYSTSGNLELLHANVLNGTGDFYDIFNFPKQGEAGGLPSNSESYYSFNYANIHFVSLESNIDALGSNNLNLMINWLNADLSANTQKWTIVMFHYPPYTKGMGDSDLEPNMISCRTVIVPILETHNVDLILSSHSHTYERSVLMKNHYGPSTTFSPAIMAVDTSSGSSPGFYDKTSSAVKGSVYAVLGSIADNLPVQTGWPHPAMYTSIDSTSGSIVIDVYGDTLNFKYLTSTNTIADQFGMIKLTSTVGIKDPENETEKLLLYPDPVNSLLTIQYSGKNDESVKISIVNCMGQTIKNKEINGKFYFENLDVSGMNKGVYFIRLQGKLTNITKRFIKN